MLTIPSGALCKETSALFNYEGMANLESVPSFNQYWAIEPGVIVRKIEGQLSRSHPAIHSGPQWRRGHREESQESEPKLSMAARYVNVTSLLFLPSSYTQN